MNMNNFKDLFIKAFLEKGYISLEVEDETKDAVRFFGSRKIANTDIECGVLVDFFEDDENENTYCVNFVYRFDNVDLTYEYMLKINEYNCNVPFFKAYTYEYAIENFLTLQVSTLLSGDVNDLVQTLVDMDDELDSENALPYLNPLFEKNNYKD